MKSSTVSLLCALAALAAAATLAACASGGSGVGPERPDLTGTWLLNDLASDDPREIFRDPSRDPADPALPGGNRERVDQRVSGVLATARVFRIEQNDSTVTIVLQDGRGLTFFHDGREVEERVEGLGTTVTKARLKSDELEIERKLEAGSPRIVTTYELSDDGRQLIVKFRMSSPGRSVTFERVYDAAQR